MTITIDKQTIQKFDVPGPRYTSYPTAPVWTPQITQNHYIERLKQFGASDKTLSLYIHIPFCRSMCTYCACSVVIRKNDEKYGEEYIRYLTKEIGLVSRHIGKRKLVKQFHWGGGTPTFLSEGQIQRLFHVAEEKFDIDRDGEIAIEIDPRTIDKGKIKTIRELGFNRISLGVQDFSYDVQKNINRIQPYALVKEVYDYCRALKFLSINFDLIYGLPNQTNESFKDTINKVIALKPDRIALYSFAYVPWLKKHQNKIDPGALPNNNEKMEIFLQSREQFTSGGYEAIAMDHFALKNDELAKAFHKGKLYRNFMGYTVKPADEYVGLGMTAIGFLENTYFQNEKTLPEYYARLDQNQLPIERGKALSQDDRIRQWTINSLMCQFYVDKPLFHKFFNIPFDEYFRREQGQIQRCADDGLLEISVERIRVTELGKVFIRNVCMHFDQYLQQKDSPKRFSRTV
ncbi:MAG TPA: oxygen-independent coproporphyrinogen III oxidase [Candidatus Omnitrophota bacterium]|nr:oxygen-independent coproporphyrinogen III oxidase [Candidatus Omnitrophota bacterium]